MAAEFDGWAIARQRIEKEARERTGKLDLRGLGLEEIPPEVTGLAHLRELVLLDEDIFNPTTNARQNRIADLGPLARLTALQSLDLDLSEVDNLAPLAQLTALQSLDCSFTQVADLAPLARLTALRSLKCGSTRVADLAPLARLTALQSLDCSQTQVADLAPLARLTALQSLNCKDTQVADLAPLARLTALRSLNCSQTQVADLAPLSRLTALQSLDCNFTQVADLAPATLTALRSLRCDRTKLTDLSRLHDFPALAQVEANFLRLGAISRIWVESVRASKLVLYDTYVRDIPAGILSNSDGDNCLPALRAYYEDSGPDDPRVEDVKLMVLGNGRVGKTQLCRNLAGEKFEPESESTHGVTVETVELPRGQGKSQIPVHIWDFGGQDIYHGTHALFLRDHAIFALVWGPAFETRDPAAPGALFGHRPLRYWVDYVRQLGGEEQAVVIAQTRCDRPADDSACPVAEADLRAAFARVWRVHFSAATARGEATLRDALVEAAEFALEREGAPRIPAAWARVKAAIEALRERDQRRPIAKRRHRTLTTDEFAALCRPKGVFAALCRQKGVRSEPEHLLQYLHRTGIVFHRPDLMRERIVLDQGWALEAIYAVFARGAAYDLIKRNGGRFRPGDLAITAWRDRSPAERAVFFDMMRACGVCFQLDRRFHAPHEYLAPELAPSRADIADAIWLAWETGQPVHERRYRYSLLHDGLIRALIAGVGEIAGGAGVYWRDGVAAFEKTTGARALIEQKVAEGWSGEIVVQTRGGQAEALLARLCQFVEETQWRLGVEGKIEAPPPAIAEREQAPPLVYGRDPAEKPRRYVSFAWADNEDPNRRSDVDRLCDAALARGDRIIRDKDALRRGDRISDFMREIGRGDRVYVFLSDKYLKSPFCMFELFQVWDNSRRDPDEFHERVRLYLLDDVNIRKLSERLRYAEYWQEELEAVEARTAGVRLSLLSDEDFKSLRQMRDFANHVGNILWLLAGTVQPRDFEEFLEYAFDDPPAKGTGG
jgi:internalin A